MSSDRFKSLIEDALQDRASPGAQGPTPSAPPRERTPIDEPTAHAFIDAYYAAEVPEARDSAFALAAAAEHPLIADWLADVLTTDQDESMPFAAARALVARDDKRGEAFAREVIDTSEEPTHLLLALEILHEANSQEGMQAAWAAVLDRKQDDETRVGALSMLETWDQQKCLKGLPELLPSSVDADRIDDAVFEAIAMMLVRRAPDPQASLGQVQDYLEGASLDPHDLEELRQQIQAAIEVCKQN